MVVNNGLKIIFIKGTFNTRPFNPTLPIVVSQKIYSGMTILRELVVEYETGWYALTITNSGTLAPLTSGTYYLLIIGF